MGKKLILVACLLSLVCSFTAFSKEQYTIGVACQSMTSAPTRIANEVQKLAQKEGWKVVTFDGDGDIQKVVDAAKVWIKSGVDAVYVMFPPAASLDELIKAANSANVPIITTGYSSGAGQTFEVGMNNFEASAKISSYLIDRIGGNGEIVIFHWDVVPTPRHRIAVLDAMLKEYPGVKTVKRHHTKLPGHIEDVRKVMEATLLANPKPGSIDAVWGAWDELALGAVQAIEAAGRKDIFVVGIDGNLWTFDYIRKGTAFAATIAPDWEQCATILIEQLKRIKSGKGPEKSVFYIDIPLVTKENCPPPGQYYRSDGNYN